jgi:hypothetical protein
MVTGGGIGVLGEGVYVNVNDVARPGDRIEEGGRSSVR